jgi:hypothetical protein
LYAIVDNFDCFPCISLHQYEIILTLISTVVPGENQTVAKITDKLYHSIVSSTSSHERDWTHNISGDRN